ncbi:hypothetical protein M758_6G199400 [Ceratodon purpureus]|nr:hypothetical protein M758_6G199400 [Ceratodon purpureus]
MELDDRPSLGLGHLESFKNRASFLFKDSLKIARLALVDVSTAELMTEEATNADEWGPTPKSMSDICGVIYNSEDYLRVVQVLHKRFSLSAKKYWRQIHKSLILLEYLLCHGPEHLVMEFREDKGRLEELTRFVYVDWTGIDRGSALQRRAKHVLHLLMDEAFYKEQRRRAQKTSKVISGFGSQSFYQRTARPGLSDTRAHSKSDSELLEQDPDSGDSSTLLVDEDNQPISNADYTKKNFTLSDEDTSSPTSQRESSWGAFSTTSPGGNRSASCRSTCSTTSDANPYEDSPTSVLAFRRSPHILDMDMDSLVSDLKPPVEESSSQFPPPPPMSDYKCVMLRPPPSQLAPVSPKGETRSSLVQKLPPPPPVAEYKCIMPRSPQHGSRVRRTQPGSVKSEHVTPDLILI